MVISKNLETLMKEAIKVYDGMPVVFPQFSSEAHSLQLAEIRAKFSDRYAVNNSTLAFLVNGDIYVIPYSRHTEQVLTDSGLTMDNFYVPFSNWDYPSDQKSKWEKLCQQAKQTRKLEFAEDCIRFCEKHHIGTLSEETLAKCFKMPDTGVPVKHLYFQDTYYPAITATCMDCTVIDKLGHYCCNNGRVVFVYQDGTTYVAKGYAITNELQAAGYTQSGLFVPFSNGEEIQDSSMRARWESITK